MYLKNLNALYVDMQKNDADSVYTYVLFPTSPGIFQFVLFLHMSLRQLSPRLSGLLILLYVPKNTRKTHKKKECSQHSKLFPLFILCI